MSISTPRDRRRMHQSLKQPEYFHRAEFAVLGRMSGRQQPTTAGETHGQITLRQRAKKERGGPGRAELIGG
jgi:hypothetical protein